MDIYARDLGSGFSSIEPLSNPRLTVRCEYPGSDSPPDEVTFRLSPRYGLLTARDTHDWFLKMMSGNEEFEVETDEPCEWLVPFWVKSRVVCKSERKLLDASVRLPWRPPWVREA